MRNWALCFILAATALPTFPANRVTVEQLEQVLADDKSKPDAEVAKQLADLELTERLSPIKLDRMEGGLPGKRSQQALMALADASAFLDLPLSEAPATAAPDIPTQRRIMALAVSYISRTLPHLPDLLATRVTERFEDSPREQSIADQDSRYRPLHSVGGSNVTVLYRDGKEAAEPADAKKAAEPAPGLSTWGEFGPVLTTVFLDAAQNTLAWSHWEQGAGGPLAVFRYEVPREKSHYEVDYCCIPDSDGMRTHIFHQLAGYHGEITIDSASGNILRLKLEAELKPGDPVVRAAIVVEYGLVDIGGKPYVCPLKSIALSLAQASQTIYDVPIATAPMGAGGTFQPRANSHLTSTALGPQQTLLNDAVFEQYHVFRADTRIVDAHNVAPDAASPSSGQPTANTNPSETASAATAASPTAPPPPENNVPSVASAPATASTPAPAPAPPAPSAPDIPEITVAAATALPSAPSNPHPVAHDNGFTLRTTARLVDVGVVAYDKRGHPVTDLKPEDFELYDNGRKQDLRFISQTATEPSTSVPTPPDAADSTTPSSTSTQSEFSNRRPAAADGKAPAAASESNVTVLLIDAGNLAWGDLTYARAQMLHFLNSLSSNERVGLYIMKADGFEVLQEPAVDHAQLAAKLSRWMPNAQELARAQDEEQRNRQHFDWVCSKCNLASVNGNSNIDPENFTSGLSPLLKGPADAAPTDPKLQSLGSNPERDALFNLAGVAGHLAAIPGHKNLVWVSSDNVLADWSNQAAVRQDKGSKFIDSLALRAQEALNDAHASIYPLDASQLEAGGITADIGNRNVLPVGKSDRSASFAGMGDAAPGMKPGRDTAQMQQDTHPIQGAFRQLADSTGGRVFRRSGGIANELDSVVNDGRAGWLLSFTPDQPADDKYHLLTVKLTGRRDITLRYRTGYQYDKEPSSLRDRFRQAISQPADTSEIALTADPVAAAKGSSFRLNIAATDIDLEQQGEVWSDKLDIFIAQRDDAGLHAKVTGQTLGLRLKPATYQKFLREGIPFSQVLEPAPGVGSVRILVVDENSGRMGSVTIPAAAIGKSQ